ncbi:MAG: DUF192 domain-containing protein [Candidatus Paceibacterota bacterium]|jgi:hypothetical protein
MLRVITLNKLTLGALYASIVAAILIAVILVVPEREARVFLLGQEVKVLIADTPALQERGLSGHSALIENEGMLFVFPVSNRTGFWMKNMLFPIDIIWFDGNRRVVDAWENAQPSSYPEIRAPRSDAQYVLEVRAGFYRNHNIRLGDVLEVDGPTGYNK